MEYTLSSSAGKVGFTFDRLNRRRSLTHPSFTQTIPEKGFDGVGNLRHQQMQDPIGISDLSYGYDDLYQLTEEEGHSYAYDSLNNRIVQDGSFHEVNALSQLLKALGIAYSYDLNGNLIQKNDGNGITTYAYDAWNRMIKVQTPDVSVSYTYDAFNRRLAKSGALEEVYLYDGQEEIGIYKDGWKIRMRTGESLRKPLLKRPAKPPF